MKLKIAFEGIRFNPFQVLDGIYYELNEYRGNWLVLLGYAELSNNITNTLLLLEHLKVDYLSPEFRLWISWDPHANNVTGIIKLYSIMPVSLTVYFIQTIGKWPRLLAVGEHVLLLLRRCQQCR